MGGVKLVPTCVLLLLPALASAQPAPAAGEPAPPPDRSSPASATDPAAPAAPIAPAVGAPAATTPPAVVGWPQAIIARPLTLRAGLIGVQADLAVAQITGLDGGSTVGAGFGLSAGYGVTEQLAVGAAYAFALKEFEAKGPFSLTAAFRLADGHFKAAADGAFIYDLNGEVGAITAGLAAQLDLSDEVAIFTPGNQLVSAVIVPEGAATPVALNLPLGLGLQASPEIFAFAQSTIATVDLKDSVSTNIFSDAVNVQVGAFYSPTNELDIGATIVFPDVAHAGDNAAIVLTGRVFAN
jgi:hypothetical protein